MNVLVTGAAGFIGSNLCMRLLEEQLDTLVVGLDNLNTYYDVNIKQWRLEQLTKFGNRFVFVKGNIADKALVDKLFDEYQPQIVVNLAWTRAALRATNLPHLPTFLMSGIPKARAKK